MPRMLEEPLRRGLEHVVGQLTDSVVMFGRRGRVHFANDAYLRWCGKSRGEIIGSLAWRLPGAPGVKQDLRWARRRLASGQDWQRDYPVASSADPRARRFVFVTVSPIRDASGQVADFVAVGRDVTEVRRLESIAEAKNFHEHIGGVFAGLRHEIGNPINSIKTALQLVTSGFDTMPRERQRNYLERTVKEIGRVEYLLRALRSFNLYEVPRLGSVDVRSFLSGFQRLAGPDIERLGVRLVIEIDEEADVWWADPRALHQVLLNLVGNATTFLAGQADATITMHAGQAGRYGTLSVRDNGPGISPDDLPYVFQAFYTTRPDGTGLGLAITRRLLSLMRGSIELSSSDTGTEALIYLDRKEP